MLLQERARVGYVVKRYPRYSETFIVNEILAHEAAGLDIEIFSLRPPNDGHFQDVFREFVATREKCGEGADGGEEFARRDSAGGEGGLHAAGDVDSGAAGDAILY